MFQECCSRLFGGPLVTDLSPSANAVLFSFAPRARTVAFDRWLRREGWRLELLPPRALTAQCASGADRGILIFCTDSTSGHELQAAIPPGSGPELRIVVDQSNGDQVAETGPGQLLWPSQKGDIVDWLKRRMTGAGPCEAASESIIGNSSIMRHLLRAIRRASVVDAPVLIEGRTGTGKELVAREIHQTGTRAGFPFVPVNCGALPDSMLESELFGHTKGAFTDAREARAGLIGEAEKGSIFLDEIDSLSPKGQASLLRFLQSGEYRPVGSDHVRSADVRIIAAANTDLMTQVQAGAFREDLFFRLGVLILRTPCLNERPSDVEPLARHFLTKICRTYNLAERRFSARTLDAMVRHPWPGNVRELENFVHRACVMTDGDVIDTIPGQLCPDRGPVARQSAAPEDQGSAGDPGTGDRADPIPGFHAAKAQAIETFERGYLARLMEAASGNVTRAAVLAGTERRTLGKLLKRHGLR